MKKSKLFILVSLLTLWYCAQACGPYYISAADNRIYRVLPPLWKPANGDDFVTQNLLLWSQQTGCTDTSAIRQAIYQGTLADWERLYEDIILKKHIGNADIKTDDWFYPNTFIRNIKNYRHNADKDAISLLYFSKRYEALRNAQRSPWYYNSRVGTDEKRELEKLYNTVLEYCSAKSKYADRWRFLTIKCAWATDRHDTVLALWKAFAPTMKKSILYDETEEYVARSLENLGRQEEAYAIYRRQGKCLQLIPAYATTAARLRLLLQIDPNSPDATSIIQDYLTDIDRDQAASYPWGPEEYQADSVLAVAKSALANPKVRNKSVWRYAAACILDYKGKPSEALSCLRGPAGGDTFLRRSTRILTFYLRSKTEPINDDFEEYALKEIQWLDGQMLRDWKRLPAANQFEISNVDGWGCTNETNCLYSYAVLRRIVLTDSTGLAWRMARAGRPIRALQMANLADNHFIQICNNKTIKHVRRSSDSTYLVWYQDNNNEFKTTSLLSPRDTTLLSGSDFMIWPYHFNHHDYSNGLFALADAMPAKAIEQYRQRQLRPQDDIDRWFNARGYTNGDYWQDIIGTHYLRERKYTAAVAHLRYVSPSYQRRMNIRCYIDPFGINRTYQCQDSTQCKLHFAQRMDSLQRVMLHSRDADRRGLAMLEYTIGLENSFGMCWWLTSYQKDLIKDISVTEYAQKATSAVKQLRAKALTTLRTDDARARYHLRLGRYNTVLRKYADTPTAKNLALVCDNRDLYRKSKQ